MVERKYGNIKVWGAIIIALFVIDRILKYWSKNLPDGEAFAFIPKIEFGYFLNPSLFFFPVWSFVPWVALGVLIVLFGFWIWKSRFGIWNSPQGFFPILLGGLSNVLDRFAYGGVIDYVNIVGLATLNLADILILSGILLIIFKPNVYDQRG